jgi:hypothetical protein
MIRELVWFPKTHAYGCDRCDWVFTPSWEELKRETFGVAPGPSFRVILDMFREKMEKDFREHKCHVVIRPE